MVQTSVGEALARGGRTLSSTSETASRDAQVLLAELMGRPREWLLAHPEAPVPSEIEGQLASAIQRISAGEPLCYVLGWREFYGRRFVLTPRVLIPRPETELLVEKGLQVIDGQSQSRVVIDIGTGSGCVGVTLVLERPRVHAVCSDVSRAALLVARENAARLGAGDRVGFVMADLAGAFSLDDAVVLANLPYVASEEASALRCEPHLAIDGGVDGTQVMRKLLQQLGGRRPHRATALLEIGAGQGRTVKEMASALCRPSRAWVEPDLAGHDRILRLEF